MNWTAFCEGNHNGRDFQLINLAFRDCVANIEAKGGCEQVRAAVDNQKRQCAFTDRDFGKLDNVDCGKALVNPKKNALYITWNRNEIENYWIDPQIVAAAGQDLDGTYAEKLREVAIATAPAQALLMTLFRVNSQVQMASAKTGISNECNLKEENSINILYEKHGDIFRDIPVTREQFEAIYRSNLQQCSEGGKFFDSQNFLTFFSGKRLLSCMATKGLIKGSEHLFIGKVYSGLKALVTHESPQALRDLVPEWQEIAIKLSTPQIT